MLITKIYVVLLPNKRYLWDVDAEPQAARSQVGSNATRGSARNPAGLWWMVGWRARA